MSEQTTTKDKSFSCLECQNSNKIEPDYKEGDVVECEFCGIEYEIEAEKDGEFSLSLIEEEK